MLHVHMLPSCNSIMSPATPTDVDRYTLLTVRYCGGVERPSNAHTVSYKYIAIACEQCKPSGSLTFVLGMLEKEGR